MTSYLRMRHMKQIIAIWYVYISLSFYILFYHLICRFIYMSFFNQGRINTVVCIFQAERLFKSQDDSFILPFYFRRRNWIRVTVFITESLKKTVIVHFIRIKIQRDDIKLFIIKLKPAAIKKIVTMSFYKMPVFASGKKRNIPFPPVTQLIFFLSSVFACSKERPSWIFL